jgi:hypothetical protein
LGIPGKLSAGADALQHPGGVGTDARDAATEVLIGAEADPADALLDPLRVIDKPPSRLQ